MTSQLDEEIERLRAEEAALLKELDEVSEERAGVAAELAALQISEKELEKEEEQLHREINQYEHRLAEVREEGKCLILYHLNFASVCFSRLMSVGSDMVQTLWFRSTCLKPLL